MFITVPLILIAASLIALAVVVWRKWPYLRKLEPESHPVGRTFIHDLAPEAMNRLEAFHWRNYWHSVLAGFEFVLGRVQTFFVSVNRASERLARSVRQSSIRARQENEERAKQVQAIKESEPPKRAEPDGPIGQPEPKRAEPGEEREKGLKEEEQRLIVAIAQDPKDAVLYRRLSDVYLRLGNLADAVEALKAAVKMEPDNKKLSERLGSLQERMDRKRTAEEEG